MCLGNQVNSYYEAYLGWAAWGHPAGHGGWIEVARVAGAGNAGWGIASMREAWWQAFRNDRVNFTRGSTVDWHSFLSEFGLEQLPILVDRLPGNCNRRCGSTL